MPAETLVPGYRLVGDFGPDSEYETRPSANKEGSEEGEAVEEEVEYVTLEISGIADVDPGLLTSYRLIVSFHANDMTPFFRTLSICNWTADLDSFPLPLCRCPALSISTACRFRRAWTLQRPFSSCQVQEQSLKAAITSSLALNSCLHIPRVSNHASTPFGVYPLVRWCPEAELLIQTVILMIGFPPLRVAGDSDPPARNVSFLGTTENRIVFSPVEIRNPASGTASKGETPGKDSKKGKKKIYGANGIEDVVGSPGVGISKPSALDEQDIPIESDPSTRNKAAGKKKEDVPQEDDDMYATEEEGVGEGVGGDGTFEADLSPRAKRDPARNDGDQSIHSPTVAMPSSSATLATATELNIFQEPPVTGSDVLMVIDPALEALDIPSKQPPPSSHRK